MNEIKSDIVIIGSGIAGALIAYKLSLKGLKVLIVEAGPRIDAEDVREKFKQSPHMHSSAGYPNEHHAPIPTWDTRTTFLAKGSSDLLVPEYLRCVGGTTWHWSAVSHRFSKNDFTLKKTYGVGVDWPLRYEELYPYYEEANREMGISGRNSGEEPPYPMKPTPASYLESWVQKKLSASSHALSVSPMARNSVDYDGRPQCQGFSTCSPICPSTARYTAVVHIEKAEEHGVRVLENTRVDQIVVGDDQKISHLMAKKPDGSPLKISGNQFILAANAFESPRLLLNSATTSHPQGVSNSSNYVGRNLMTHLIHTANYTVQEDVFPGRGPNSLFFVNQYRDKPFRKNSAGFIVQLFNVFNPYVDYHMNLLDKVYPPQLDIDIKKRYKREVSFASCIEMLPNLDNTITVDPTEKDSAGVPKMRIKYSYSDYEKRAVSKCTNVYKEIGKQLEAVETSISPLSPITSHLMGTLTMGNDPKKSVTDKFGRSHDHPNLFIAGSALFPTSSPVNPTLTIAALSLRTADEIIRNAA